MKEEPNTQHLNIFLVKPEISTIDQIIREADCSKHLELDIPDFGPSHFYIKYGKRKFPKWASLFDGIVDVSEIGKTNGVSVALVVKTSNRFFVLSFGQGGRFLLQSSAMESRFGLLVTLNSVAIESLRCIDKQSLDNLESQSRIQSSYETTSDQFGIDVEQDMLKAVVGSPEDKKLGSRMTGADSLSVSVKTDIVNVKFLLDSYLSKFEQDLSDKGYEWVNNISNIKNNPSLIDALETALEQKLQKKDFKNVWLSIPEIIQWDVVKGFMFTCGRKIIHSDITMDGFMTTVNDEKISLDLLKDRKVSCADEDHNCVNRSWPVYRCLYAELNLEGAKYVLNDGDWFRIEPDFVTKTNSNFSKISFSGLSLPFYKHENEGAYNQSVSASMPEEYALLDDKNKVSHGGGHGQVEICDLFSAKKNLIHIKRYGKSSVLSHLFSQGFVSGQLMQLDADFRAKIKTKLPTSFRPLISEDNRPEDQEFTITFAVISEDQGEGLRLPFFSRVNLNNTHRILRGYGFKVELLKIKVDPIFSKTKKIPPRKAPKRKIGTKG
ncbi:MAG: TIGR04141 family sporadically distributed protein [Thermodesulfobacteriota bacterium]